MHQNLCRQSPALSLAPILLLYLAGSAHGQTNADLTLASGYAARGVELHASPVLQLRLEHDAESAGLAGWYAGGFASPASFAGHEQGELIAYAGRAQRLTSTLSWDAGVSRTMLLRDDRWNYHEWYAGLTLENTSVRVLYSPAYYGDARSAYLDLNGAYPLDDRLHLAIHAGLLRYLGAYPAPAGGVADVRAGIGLDAGDISIEAGWQVKSHAGPAGTAPAHGVTASASLHF